MDYTDTVNAAVGEINKSKTIKIVVVIVVVVFVLTGVGVGVYFALQKKRKNKKNTTTAATTATTTAATTATTTAATTATTATATTATKTTKAATTKQTKTTKAATTKAATTTKLTTKAPGKKCDAGDSKRCVYRTRELVGDTWLCPSGYLDTGCDWVDGDDLGAKQCKQCSASVRPQVCTPGDSCEYKPRELVGDIWTCPPGYLDTGCDWVDGDDLGAKQCRKPGCKAPKTTTTKTTKKPAKCAPGNAKTCIHRPRELSGDTWVCPPGFDDTGCGWADGDNGPKQCKKCLSTGDVPKEWQRPWGCTPGDTGGCEFRRREFSEKAGTYVCAPGFVDTGCDWPDGPPNDEFQCRSIKCTPPTSTSGGTTTDSRPTNITFYGQDAADDNGAGAGGIDLFKYGSSGQTFNGRPVYPVAVHQDDADYMWKVLEVGGEGLNTIYGHVVDMCNREDGPCNPNRSRNGYNFLVDIHKTGFGAAGKSDGVIKGWFKVVGEIRPSSLWADAFIDGDQTYVLCQCPNGCSAHELSGVDSNWNKWNKC